MRKILGAVLIAAVLAGGSGIVYVGAAASGTSDGSDAAANSGEILEITGETDYSMAQEPGAESEAAFEECFAGSDIPMPEAFLDLRRRMRLISGSVQEKPAIPSMIRP